MHSIVLVIAAILLAAGAQAQPLELKFSHFLGPASFFQHDVAEPFAKELEAKSGGRAKVAIYNASSPLGKPTEQATQAKAGTVDIALGLRGEARGEPVRPQGAAAALAKPHRIGGARGRWGRAGSAAGKLGDGRGQGRQDRGHRHQLG